MNHFVCCLLLFLAAWNSAAATYVFQGKNYQFINGPNYSENMSLSGFIEFAQEMESSSTINSDSITNYRFNDGVQILDQSNSEIFLGSEPMILACHSPIGSS